MVCTRVRGGNGPVYPRSEAENKRSPLFSGAAVHCQGSASAAATVVYAGKAAKGHLV